jgi:hypothetical protein
VWTALEDVSPDADRRCESGRASRRPVHAPRPIAGPRRTRQSIVFHYMPEDASIHGVDAFFSHPFTTTPNPLGTERGRKLFDHGQPRFDHNT